MMVVMGMIVMMIMNHLQMMNFCEHINQKHHASQHHPKKHTHRSQRRNRNHQLNPNVSNPSHEITEQNVCLTRGHGVDCMLTKLKNMRIKMATTATKNTPNNNYHNQEHNFDSKGSDGVTGTGISNGKSTHSRGWVDSWSYHV